MLILSNANAKQTKLEIIIRLPTRLRIPWNYDLKENNVLFFIFFLLGGKVLHKRGFSKLKASRAKKEKKSQQGFGDFDYGVFE